MSDDRCYGCCHENCMSGAEPCSCSCHARNRPIPLDKIPKGNSTRMIIDMGVPCKACGLRGAHFCPGQRHTDAYWWSELERARVAAAQCSDHKRYQGKRKPRANCEGCWRIWIALNPSSSG